MMQLFLACQVKVLPFSQSLSPQADVLQQPDEWCRRSAQSEHSPACLTTLKTNRVREREVLMLQMHTFTHIGHDKGDTFLTSQEIILLHISQGEWADLSKSYFYSYNIQKSGVGMFFFYYWQVSYGSWLL